MLFPHTVTVYPSEYRTDADGNTVRWPGAEGVPVPAYLQPRTSRSDDAGAGESGPSQRGRVDAVVYLSKFCPSLDAYALIVHNEQPYALVAEPVEQRSPGDGIWMFKAELTRTEARHG